MSKNFTIGGNNIGCGEACFIIAEVAQAHDGSLGIAHSYIDAVAQAGADAIKFQTHIAAAESSIDEPFRVNFSYEDPTRYDYWKRMEFTEDQWIGLAEHCEEAGIVFLSSPFSNEAVDMLVRVGMPAWKVGSGEVNNSVILNSMTETKKPILLSSGMSCWEEIDKSVSTIKKSGTPLALFQCTSIYPTLLNEVGLNLISDMRERYRVPIGLSDHSGLTSPALAAIATKADLLEVHVVFDKQLFGPDTKASITISQLKEIVAFRDQYFLMDQNPINKDEMALKLSDMKSLFNKSVVLTDSINKGEPISRKLLDVKKPGIGIPANCIEDCIGKKARKNFSKGHILKWDDLVGSRV